MIETGFVLLDGGIGFFLCNSVLVINHEFTLVAVETTKEDGRGVCKGCEVGKG